MMKIEMINQLHQYLENKIIPARIKMNNLSVTTFFKELNSNLEDINVATQYPLKEILKDYEGKKGMSASLIYDFVGRNAYDSLKNLTNFSTDINKEVLYKVTLCFTLKYEETKDLLEKIQYTIKPTFNLTDAAYYFYSHEWKYYEKNNTEKTNIELFQLCVEETINYIVNVRGMRNGFEY